MKKTVLAILAIFILMSSLTVAQDDSMESEPPLLALLSLVPDNSVSRSGELYFNDKLAISLAYPEAELPPTWNDVQENPDGNVAWELWWQIFLKGSSTPNARNTLVNEMPMTVGFDYLDVTREINYGTPPALAIIFQGNFDTDQINQAFTDLGFVSDTVSDVELLCSTDGCNQGMNVDIEARQQANPFGGDLGRRWPLYIGDSYLMSAPALPSVTQHLSTIDGTQSSLADNASYRAGVEAISQYSDLIQAIILDSSSLESVQLNPNVAGNAPIDMDQFQELPMYELLLLGDSASDEQHITMVALVYSDMEQAETAGDILLERINTYQTARDMSFSEMLTERFQTPETRIYETDDRVVLVIDFMSPRATSDEILELSDFMSTAEIDKAPPSVFFANLVQAFMIRDLGWLSTVPRAN